MKKLIVLLLTVLLTAPLPVQAQRRYYHESGGNRYYRPDHRPALYYGLRLGLNLSSVSSEDLVLDTDCLAGLYFGGVLGIQLAPRSPAWFELGLGYSEKGGINKIDGYKVRYRISYLEMPLAVKFNIDIKALRIQPFLGGYLSVGVAGKIKDYKTRVKQSTYDLYRRFDGGLRLGCGAEYQMIYIEAGFDFGLANINKDDFDTAHNRCLYISAGVNF
ncbi:MAG: PorT family protein [Prevotella sp.]|nr:PorT family protein [Prevotella sp.]